MFGHKTVVFWHIPWPENVPEEYAEVLTEIAAGLLGTSILGFHTNEYALNFMSFVRTHLPEYHVDPFRMTIEDSGERLPQELQSYSRGAGRSYVLQRNLPTRGRGAAHSTRLLVHPLGVDFEFWSDLKESSKSIVDPQLEEIAAGTYILSVDRVDYTKSVLDRIHIIDKFFAEHPQWRGTLTFVQICGRSRPGLAAFDKYWDECKAVADRLNERWQQDGWQPLRWLEKPLGPKELAYLYSHAHAMLVNPVRDGLNLTAKEFVVCQGENAGTLLLSPGAGAIHELGNFALPAPPQDHAQTIDSLSRSLTMPLKERQLRVLKMKTSILSNQLSHWWATFSGATESLDMQVAATEEAAKRNLG
jgi:trehalose 6-phosphate synthase